MKQELETLVALVQLATTYKVNPCNTPEFSKEREERFEAVRRAMQAFLEKWDVR